MSVAAIADSSLYLLAVLAGIVAGIITGLLPGLHINLVSVIAASLLHDSLPGPTKNMAFAAFIMAMSISHVFHDFIPSVFLGFSESDAALAVLPGHRMLLAGMGKKAVMLAALGGLSGVLGMASLAPILLATLKPVFLAIKGYIGAILMATIAIHFLKCKTIRDAAINMVVLALSGLFGIAVFSLPSISEPLLPMFSGLFGMSSIIGGLIAKPTFPKQNGKATIKSRKPLKAARILGLGLLSSSLMGMFPAVGPAQAAMLGTAALKKLKPASYMFLLGAISSASMLFSLFTLYSFGKARNGSIAVMGSAIQINLSSLVLLLAAAILSASVSVITTSFASRLFSSLTERVDYRRLNWAMAIAIMALAAAFSGLIGITVLFVATAIGMVPMLAKSSRQLLMGCLMVPVILHYA